MPKQIKPKTETEKLWEEGEKHYSQFCKNFRLIRVVTPRTNTLEMIARLMRGRYVEDAVFVCMKEFLGNWDDSIMCDEKGLYQVESKRKYFK